MPKRRIASSRKASRTRAGERIGHYQRAVRAMQEGRYDSPVPLGPKDEVGLLGEEISSLGRHLEARFAEASRLQAIAADVASGLFLDDVLAKVYDSFRALIPYDRIGCALLTDENRTLTAYWAKTTAKSPAIKPGYSAPMQGSSLQQILDSGRPRIINDLAAYAAAHPQSASTHQILAEGVRSSFTCPLIAAGKPVGFLFFSSRRKNTYQDVHQGVYLQIAGQLSALVEKSRLYQQLYELNQKLLFTQRQLEVQATHDALTGLLNRGAIEEMLRVELSRARRRAHAVGILLIDIDHFKRVNDTYGHAAGDDVLKAVAQELAGGLRGYDHVGRYGGEEFLVVLGEAEGDSAADTAERLRAAIEEKKLRFGNASVSVTLSAGVAVAQDATGVRSDAFVALADRALYRAKNSGRNRVVKEVVEKAGVK